MGLIVQKFGGSSVANAERVMNVARIVTDTYKAGNDVVVVVSAQGDTTDDLIAKANEINPKASKREMDMLLASGEQISISLLAMAIESLGFPVCSLLGWQAGFSTNSVYGSARIKKVKADRIIFVWLQGESDAIVKSTKEYYKNSLRTLCDALKKDVGIDLFGIIRVGRFTNDERDLEIITAQDEICRESDDFAMLTDIATTLNTQSEHMHPRIKGHYSAKGLETLGEAAAKGLYNHLR